MVVANVAPWLDETSVLERLVVVPSKELPTPEMFVCELGLEPDAVEIEIVLQRFLVEFIGAVLER